MVAIRGSAVRETECIRGTEAAGTTVPEDTCTLEGMMRLVLTGATDFLEATVGDMPKTIFAVDFIP